MTTTRKKTTAKAPWTKAKPKAKAGHGKSLTPSQKATAKRSAKAAGRPYPNMVDNMKVARKAGKKKSD